MTTTTMSIAPKPHWLARSAICTAFAALFQLGIPGVHATAADASKEALPVPAGYEQSRVLIPMRDGVHLDTFVLAPTDATRSYPILLVRTPYEVSGNWSHLESAFTDAGYIFVTQSVRGRYKSEGEFIQMTPHKAAKPSRTDVDASSDTFDTIDWLIKNVPRNNGRVGLRGISYGGFYAAAGMIDAHPALKAVSPQAPQADWFAGDDETGAIVNAGM